MDPSDLRANPIGALPKSYSRGRETPPVSAAPFGLGDLLI